ncbi:MAG: FHA domain-containing protein [Proteobacteria bacterium]|nr:FHA domain-containing protein [Pseudomonadota bacterium]
MDITALKKTKSGIASAIAFFCGIVVVVWAPMFWGSFAVYAKDSAMGAEIEAARPELDIMLVMDNSGSMIKNDPKFLTREVATNFMAGFGEKSRLGMVVFDQTARLVIPLMDVTGLVARANFLKGLEQVNYKGQLSDSPSAVERALYELKINGRTDAYQAIILLTDGIVETGDKARDLVKTQWLREDLAQESKNAGIRIFGIAFTDQADFSLIQSLAVKTDGEYFRAYTVDDIQKIFEKINKLISRLQDRAKIPAERAEITAVQKKTPPPSAKPLAVKPGAAAPAAESAPSFSKTEVKPPRPNLLHLILLIGVFVVLTIVVMIIVMNRRSQAPLDAVAGRSFRRLRHDASIPKAELIDVKNITKQRTLELNKRLIRIGRDSHNDVAIDKETVSSLHATIEYSDGFFYLEDQRSINKTYLNDEEVVPNSPRKLKSGDIIIINVYKFIFILPDLIPVGETVLDLSGDTTIRSDSMAVGGKHTDTKVAVDVPQAMLIDVTNITGKKTVLLHKRVTKIGRGVHNEIAIEQSSVSGSHAIIQFREGSFYLEDLRSKNKTCLNGKEITPDTPFKLKSGDEILFDIYKFIFLLEQQTPSGDTNEKWQ